MFDEVGQLYPNEPFDDGDTVKHAHAMNWTLLDREPLGDALPFTRDIRAGTYEPDPGVRPFGPIRARGIDAPESDQLGTEEGTGEVVEIGRRATEEANAFSEGKVMTLDYPYEGVSYGRPITTVRADGEDVWQHLVRTGNVVAYKRFTDMYEEDERIARAAGLGLWSENWVYPEEYRRGRKGPVDAGNEARWEPPKDETGFWNNVITASESFYRNWWQYGRQTHQWANEVLRLKGRTEGDDYMAYQGQPRGWDGNREKLIAEAKEWAERNDRLLHGQGLSNWEEFRNKKRHEAWVAEQRAARVASESTYAAASGQLLGPLGIGLADPVNLVAGPQGLVGRSLAWGLAEGVLGNAFVEWMGQFGEIKKWREEIGLDWTESEAWMNVGFAAAGGGALVSGGRGIRYGLGRGYRRGVLRGTVKRSPKLERWFDLQDAFEEVASLDPAKPKYVPAKPKPKGRVQDAAPGPPEFEVWQDWDAMRARDLEIRLRAAQEGVTPEGPAKFVELLDEANKALEEGRYTEFRTWADRKEQEIGVYQRQIFRLENSDDALNPEQLAALNRAKDGHARVVKELEGRTKQYALERAARKNWYRQRESFRRWQTEDAAKTLSRADRKVAEAEQALADAQKRAKALRRQELAAARKTAEGKAEGTTVKPKPRAMTLAEKEAREKLALARNEREQAYGGVYREPTEVLEETRAEILDEIGAREARAHKTYEQQRMRRAVEINEEIAALQDRYPRMDPYEQRYAFERLARLRGWIADLKRLHEPDDMFKGRVEAAWQVRQRNRLRQYERQAKELEEALAAGGRDVDAPKILAQEERAAREIEAEFERNKPKFKTLIQTVRQYGTINSESLKRDYNWKADVQGSGLVRLTSKKGGSSLDEIAQEMVSNGDLPPGTDGDGLMQMLKAKEKSHAENEWLGELDALRAQNEEILKPLREAVEADRAAKEAAEQLAKVESELAMRQRHLYPPETGTSAGRVDETALRTPAQDQAANPKYGDEPITRDPTDHRIDEDLRFDADDEAAVDAAQYKIEERYADEGAEAITVELDADGNLRTRKLSEATSELDEQLSMIDKMIGCIKTPGGTDGEGS